MDICWKFFFLFIIVIFLRLMMFKMMTSEQVEKFKRDERERNRRLADAGGAWSQKHCGRLGRIAAGESRSHCGAKR